MYLGKRELINPEKYETLRSETLIDKSGAVDIAFDELEGVINKSQLAAQYFKKSHAWLSQKLHGCTVLNRQKSFTEEEYHKLADSLRDIARRLNAHADEIDNAPMDEPSNA
ncbi:MAG: DUF5053 domain-containing protein [Muribaculaceae bacterium]|nr:DUF5053 domain-containing protein [Muribaculaceae bacterium]